MSQSLSAVQSIQSISSAYADDDDEGNLNGSVEGDKVAANKDNESNNTQSVTESKSPEKGGSVEMYISGSEDESGVEEIEPKKPLTSVATFSPLPKKPKVEKTATRLVSYGPDEIDDGDEIELEGEDNFSNDESTDVQVQRVNSESRDVERSETGESVSTDDVLLPPEAPGKCSAKLQEKITKLYEKMRREGTNLNASIQRRKDFRNPSIYEKLIDYCGIDEKGTNYPPELFNTSIWGPESYYDELAKLQKVEMDKREKEKKDRTKVEFVTATKKQTPEGSSIVEKRKSKWDAQVSAGGVSASVSVSSKTTIISATGSIKKK